MSYEDAKDYAGDVARRSGTAFAALLLICLIFYFQEAPGVLEVVVCILAGLVLYEGVHVFLLSSLTRSPALAQAQVPAVVDEELEQPATLPDPLARVIDSPWAEETNWAALYRYVQQDGAALSRAAVGGMVDQRFYSPRDGEESFPELMVAIGAASRVTNGGGLPSYIWSPRAVEVLYDLVVQGRIHAGWRPLSPTTAQ